MSDFRTFATLALCLAVLCAPALLRAQPFADMVVSYTPGADVNPVFNDPANALGMPALNNGFGEFGGEVFDLGDVTPFNAAFLPEQLVQVGDGGELVVRFDHRVLDDPANPFGIDLLVFGNGFFELVGAVAGGLFADDALISVSQYGDLWSDITSVFADGLFPTSAYTDTPGAFLSGGATLSDFTLPVDPSIDWLDKTYEQLVTDPAALYAGSGGGGGVDLAETGLPWIQYVRIQAREDPDTGVVVLAEIDAFSDVAAVPEPAVIWLSLLGLAGLRVRRRAHAAHCAARDEMPMPRRACRTMWRSKPFVQ